MATWGLTSDPHRAQLQAKAEAVKEGVQQNLEKGPPGTWAPTWACLDDFTGVWEMEKILAVRTWRDGMWRPEEGPGIFPSGPSCLEA